MIKMSVEKYPEHKKRNLLLSDRISQNSVKNIIENIFEINEDDGQKEENLQDYITRKAECYIPASEAISLKLANSYYK